MRTLPSHIENIIASDSITLATCWRIILQNESVLRFTDHHTDIVVGSETFSADGSFSRSAVSYGLGLAQDNLDVNGTIGADSITEVDLIAGKYDFATVEIFLVDYLAPNSGIYEMVAGQLGEVELSDGEFSVQLLGQAGQFKQAEIEICSPTCRANLGDARCGVNMAAFTWSGVVTSVTDAQTFGTDLALAAGVLTGGTITFSSGNNAGLLLEIKNNDALGLVNLFLPSPYAVQVGDTFSPVTRGCDKTPEACKTIFDNIINFRGEPFVPGSDKILQINAAKPSVAV